MSDQSVIRKSAEEVYHYELEALRVADKYLTPPGWKLSPKMVRQFILGDKKLKIIPKFVGDPALVDRAIVSLLGRQGLMLVGEPGTAKSMISELLTAAITGHTNWVIQGSAGIIEDHLRYGWNYAMLLNSGPMEEAMVPTPILNAMRKGEIVRIEEITRCAAEVQDVLISIMSEKQIAVPELGENVVYRAKPGFNIIATANLRDRGVHEMSSALKRRFNFETVHPIADLETEKALISSQLESRLSDQDIETRAPDKVISLLAEVFQELRNSRTKDGTPIASLNAVMSTAEAVNIAHAACLEAHYFSDGKADGSQIAKQIFGVVIKDNPDDKEHFRNYIDHIVRERGQSSQEWQQFYKAAREILRGAS